MVSVGPSVIMVTALGEESVKLKNLQAVPRTVPDTVLPGGIGSAS